MVLTPNDLFSWNNNYSKYTDIYINNAFTSYLLAMHINSLCACWHPEAVKGSSSLSSRRLLISPRIMSSLFLCPESTDAPCSRLEDPVPPFPRWRSHSQGPRTPPSQGPTHVEMTFILYNQFHTKWKNCKSSKLRRITFNKQQDSSEGYRFVEEN
jgi:hypothetical protein